MRAHSLACIIGHDWLSSSVTRLHEHSEWEREMSQDLQWKTKAARVKRSRFSLARYLYWIKRPLLRWIRQPVFCLHNNRKGRKIRTFCKGNLLLISTSVSQRWPRDQVGHGRCIYQTFANNVHTRYTASNISIQKMNVSRCIKGTFDIYSSSSDV